MNDDELETRLRDWGAAQRSAVPEVGVAPPVVPRRRGALWPALAAAAAVLAIGGVIAGVKLAGSSTRTPAAGPPTAAGSATVPPPVPAGMKRVVFHGLAVTVPATWPLNDTRCGTPVADTVVLPGPVPACAFGREPEVSSVQFYAPELNGLASTVAGPTIRAGTLVGRDAIWLTGTDRGFHVAAITVATLHAQVVVSSPDAATVQRVAASATIVATDDNGCAAHGDAADALPTGRAPSRAGADSQLVPEEPSSLTICRYVADYIEQSVRLTPSQTASLVTALNGLPRGVSRANPHDFLPSLCRRPGSTAYPDDTMDAEGYLIRASYETGPRVDVVVRLGLCGDLGASNGTVTGQRTMKLAETIGGLAGESVGLPGDVSPAN